MHDSLQHKGTVKGVFQVIQEMLLLLLLLLMLMLMTVGLTLTQMVRSLCLWYSVKDSGCKLSLKGR